MKKILIVAGEASGDLHAQGLMRALRKKDPGMEIHGVGGERMKAEGPQSHIAFAHASVTGYTGIVGNLPLYIRMLGMIHRQTLKIRPDAIVLIDNPGFNLRLAKTLHGTGIPLIYYICPQIWAWAGHRIHLMKRLFRKALVIFDFEKDIYLRHGMSVQWVGHPMKDIMMPLFSDLRTRMNGRTPGPPRIVLLPGSRMSEIKLLLPVLLKAAAIIQTQIPECEFSLIRAETIPQDILSGYLRRNRPPVHVVESDKYASLFHADLALVASGTATLECALAGLPMVIVYKSNALTAMVARRVVKVPFLGLPNLILGESIVPELLQEHANPARIAEETLSILKNPPRANLIHDRLAQVGSRLGDGHASDHAASAILQ